ncbi:MAG: cyclophilin-like fold protein [Clostridium sp.]|nr:cyclophilin-like fold protein [Clostridium sp.]
MKRIMLIICCAAVMSMFLGCSNVNNSTKTASASIEINSDVNNKSESILKEVLDSKDDTIPAFIDIENTTFAAHLYNNETAQDFIKKFPLTIDMRELNGQEKYYNFSETLSNEKGEKPKVINAGDIMIWSDNCLVLFYKTYNNSYSGYIPIGHIDDVTGLESAMGNGNVDITFSVNR